jgi:hypothetical protein
MNCLEKNVILRKIVQEHCSIGECDECGFFNPNDNTDGVHFCHARDADSNIPFYENWNMHTAMLSD